MGGRCTGRSGPTFRRKQGFRQVDAARTGVDPPEPGAEVRGRRTWPRPASGAAPNCRPAAPHFKGGRHVWSTNDAMRHAERALAEQAELAYKRNVADLASHPAGDGRRERDTGARIQRALEGLRPRGRPQPRTSALRFVSHPRPPSTSHRTPEGPQHHLTFIRRAKR